MAGKNKIYDNNNKLIGYRIKPHSFLKEYITRDLLYKTSCIVKTKGIIFDMMAGCGINYDADNNKFLTPTLELLSQKWNRTPIYFVDNDKEVFNRLSNNINDLKNTTEFTANYKIFNGNWTSLILDTDSDINRQINTSKIKTIIVDPCGWRDKQCPLSSIEYIGNINKTRKHTDLILTFQIGGLPRMLGNHINNGYDLTCMNYSFPIEMLTVILKRIKNKTIKSEDYIKLYTSLVLRNYWDYVHWYPVLPYYYLVYATSYEPYSKSISSIIKRHDIKHKKIMNVSTTNLEYIEDELLSDMVDK